MEKLRNQVATATNESFGAIKTQVETEHKALLEKIGDVSGVDFTAALSAVTASKVELNKLLQETIASSRAAVSLISAAERTVMTFPEIIKENKILYGFCVSPKAILSCNSALIRMPENPHKLSYNHLDTQKSESFTYNGAQVESFASSCFEQSSSASRNNHKC